MTIEDLVDQAYSVTGNYQPGKWCTSGTVGAALLTKGGNVYTGVSIDCACGLGFCAEHSAIAEMLKHRESEIEMIVGINTKRQIASPCGRCRELIYQVNRSNVNTRIILGYSKVVLLKELLPYPWQEMWE